MWPASENKIYVRNPKNSQKNNPILTPLPL